MIGRVLTIGLLAATLALPPLAAAKPRSYKATVTRVIDGDTIEVRKESGARERVRLKGIDAPERSQAHGDKATRSLARKVEGKEVRIVPVARDKYDRQVANVKRGRSDVGHQMVKQGHAWGSGKQERTAQAAAQAKGKGLWKDGGAVKPSDYRRQ